MEVQKSESEEIEVAELLAKGIMAIKNNFRSLLLAFLAGTALGTVFYMIVPNRYSSRMIIQSDILTEVYAASITEDLENLLNEKNNHEVSKKLGLTEAEAANVVSVSIETIKNNRNEKENSDLFNAFLVTVQVLNNSVLPKLQTGILSFLANNDYVKIREKQRRNYYAEMIAKVDKELRSLDSMKQSLFTSRVKSFNVLLMDPSNIYMMAIELNKEKIDYQHELELVSSVQLVGGFTAYSKPSFPKKSISLAGGAMLGLIIVSAILGYKALFVVVDISKKKLEQSGSV